MVDVEASFVADREATESVQPREGPLDNPTVTSKLLAGFDAASCDASLDAPAFAGLTASSEIIGLVGMELGRSASGSASFAGDGRNGIQQLVEGLAVVDVGSGQQEGERDALPVRDEMALGSRSAAVGRIGASRFTPLLAAMDELSRQARLQSSRSAWFRRCSNSRCSWSQTPAACQSRNRRQHVTPEPHAISCGSISHGMPVRSTNRMPVSAARSSTRGRPPLGLAGSTGSKGETSDHRASETRGAGMPSHESLRIRVQGF